MSCIAIVNCPFVQPLPIKEMPIVCNGVKRLAVAGSEGWHTHLWQLTVPSCSGSTKKYYVTVYINNVVAPIPVNLLNKVDLTEYVKRILRNCTDFQGRPLSELIHGCYVRGIHCLKRTSKEKIAALVAAWSITYVTNSSIELPYGKIKGNCVEIQFDVSGLSSLKNLDVVLALVNSL